MIKEMIEDVFERGERLKKDVVRQVLSSAAFSELIDNKHFAETIARVIRTKEIVSRLIRQNVQEVLKVMSIPSREQVATYDKRVQKLEHQIDRLGRQLIKKGLKTSRKKPRK